MANQFQSPSQKSPVTLIEEQVELLLEIRELLKQQKEEHLKPTPIVVNDIWMNFDSMIVFIIKWGFASLIAGIVLVPVYTIVIYILNEMFYIF